MIILCCVVEPPLFWTVPSLEGRVSGAEFSQTESAPAPGKKRGSRRFSERLNDFSPVGVGKEGFELGV